MGRELSFEETQRVALDVLIKFDSICRKEQFKYFLMYGTLIGAIRHNGFIPWDDDIDVMMPRKDFERFIQYAEDNEEALYPLKIHTRKNTKNYWYGIPRFSDLRYQYIITDDYEKPFDIGIFIDIYPLDNYGNTQEECEKLYNRCRKINRHYDWYVNKKSQGNALRSLVKDVCHYYMHIKKGTSYNERIEEEITQCILNGANSDSKYIGLVTWATKKVFFERSILGDVDCITHEFEGYQFSIPKEYDYMLTQIYGDYMKLPPEDQRIPTHNYKVFIRQD